MKRWKSNIIKKQRKVRYNTPQRTTPNSGNFRSLQIDNIRCLCIRNTEYTITLKKMVRV